MACEGAQERRDGLIADMVTVRNGIGTLSREMSHKIDEIGGQAATIFALGFLMVKLDKLAAAVIALAGPCCEDCGEDHDGVLADRNGAPDEH